MNVISYKAISHYCQTNANAEQALKTWFKTVSKAEWKDLNELKKDYPAADYVGDNRIVFNIKGNHYRLVARVVFEYKRVMVKWIGTHAEYDKIDVLKV